MINLARGFVGLLVIMSALWAAIMYAATWNVLPAGPSTASTKAHAAVIVLLPLAIIIFVGFKVSKTMAYYAALRIGYFTMMA